MTIDSRTEQVRRALALKDGSKLDAARQAREQLTISVHADCQLRLHPLVSTTGKEKKKACS